MSRVRTCRHMYSKQQQEGAVSEGGAQTSTQQDIAEQPAAFLQETDGKGSHSQACSAPLEQVSMICLFADVWARGVEVCTAQNGFILGLCSF